MKRQMAENMFCLKMKEKKAIWKMRARSSCFHFRYQNSQED